VPRPETGERVSHGSLSPLVPPPVEERIGTSLDSAGPVVVPRGPEMPSGNGPVLPPPGEDRSAFRDPLGPALSGRRTGPRPGPGPGPSPGPGNPARAVQPTPPIAGPPPTTAQRPLPGPGVQGPHQTPAGRAPANTFGGPPAGQGPMAGRPPMTGMPTTGMPTTGGTSRRDPGAGILGGIPRQTTPQPRRTPQSGIIGAHTAPALRDPTTGMVHGPSGAPLAKPPGQASSRTPAEAPRRRRNKRNSDGPSPEER
jgi:hypothetical protein